MTALGADSINWDEQKSNSQTKPPCSRQFIRAPNKTSQHIANSRFKWWVQKEQAVDKLFRNKKIIASFSRALAEGLKETTRRTV